MKSSKIDLELISPSNLHDKGVRAWFSRKNRHHNSTSDVPGLNLGLNTQEKAEVVLENRLDLLFELDIDPDWIAYADQVHSNHVRVVTQGGTYPSTDGLITRVPGLALGIQVADCAAVLLWDPVNRVIAALHAGWRGAAGDIVPLGIKKMLEQGGEAQHLKAFISPCLSVENFEVGQEVADQFPEAFVDSERYSKPHLDLKGFLREQMLNIGIPPAHIEVHKDCTVEEADKYYSYRREGKEAGRLMALIQLF